MIQQSCVQAFLPETVLTEKGTIKLRTSELIYVLQQTSYDLPDCQQKEVTNMDNSRAATPKFSQRLLYWSKTFADSIQRPRSTKIPLALEEINERKLNGGPLYHR